MQFLGDPLGSGCQNLTNPTDPDAKYWIKKNEKMKKISAWKVFNTGLIYNISIVEGKVDEKTKSFEKENINIFLSKFDYLRTQLLKKRKV